jgi:ornithine cyclodeaminase/alanine dehydrogenase-like protein (mu-crystallin family)
MLIISAEDTERHLSYHELIDSLRVAFRDGNKAPLRHHHTLPGNGCADATLLLMPAWSKDSGFGGIKIVNVNPENNANNLPSISASYLLFDIKTGQHLCLMDASEMTARRTAAASALAASYLARPESSSLLVVGAGKVGSQLPDAFRSVLPIEEVLVWNRSPGQSEALVQRLINEGWKASLPDTLEDGVRRADVISCATLTEKPLIKGEWLTSGQHVDLIGSFTPTMREVDDRALQRAKIFIDTEAAIIESGELQIPLNSGAITKDDIGSSLYELCSLKHKWREPEDIALFKGVGHAVEDLAAAIQVYKSRTSDIL